MFDIAMGLIRDQYWLNSTFNDIEVNVSYKECQGKEFPCNDYAVVHKVSVKSVYLISSIINNFL